MKFVQVDAEFDAEFDAQVDEVGAFRVDKRIAGLKLIGCQCDCQVRLADHHCAQKN